MEFKTNYITPEIKLSSYDDKLFKTEFTFEHHMLVWFISGETKIMQADASYVFGPGDIFLIPRNLLCTFINYPKDGLPHKTVAMHLSVDRLRKYYVNQDVSTRSVANKIYRFKSHPLLTSCLSSFIPYFDLKDPFSEKLASLKITEAITILRTIDKDIDGVLTNFETPGKIDLEKFMEAHFMFNLPLERFGYLTGRSLSTFNREIRKTFSSTPQKWLTKKRLELAHYRITEQF